MKKVTIGSTVAEYPYMPDGRRLSKTVNDVTTTHAWDGNNIVADMKNGITTKYIRSTKLEQAVTDSETKNFILNMHGDIITLGESEYIYDAFGNSEPYSPSDAFGYCGEYTDDETGLIYLRNRYYDPSIGRFTQEDPIKDGLNWYVYCGNNPVMFVDPSGLYYIQEDKTFCNCADPRCKNWGVPTGTYTIKPDTSFTAFTAGIVNLLPGGSVIAASSELMAGIKSGSLTTGINGAVTSSVFLGLENVRSEYLRNISKGASIADTAKYAFNAYETVMADKIVFDLLKRTNVSTTSVDAESLGIIVEKAYQFIADYSWYFSERYDTYGTLYEIDNKIYKSNNKSKTINELVTRYAYALITRENVIDPNVVEHRSSLYDTDLKNYDSRRESIEEAFWGYIR